MTTPLLEIRDLAVRFDIAGGERVQAVDGVSLTLHKNQTLALVGESGCGKTVTALSVLGLVDTPPGQIERGEVNLEGRNLLELKPRELRRVRGGEIAMIFQEPMSSLNPVHRVGEQVMEAIRLHQRVSRRKARKLAIEALHAVGIADPKRAMGAFPHEFSGGMCQRAMTATALACRPKVLIADEPTTALDVTIQAQILDLLDRLKDETGMAIMLITHDLGVVARMADVVCVMYAGRVVEYGRVFDIFDRPFHPYTRGLFSSIPRMDNRRRRLRTVGELISSPGEFRSVPGQEYGVRPWWPTVDPPDNLVLGGAPIQLFEAEPGHWVACWRTEYVAAHPWHPADLDYRRNGAVTSTPGAG